MNHAWRNSSRLITFLITYVFASFCSADDEFNVNVKQLAGAKLRALPAIVAKLESSGERALPLLRAMLDGALYYRKSDKRIVAAYRTGTGDFRLDDLLQGLDLKVASKREIKKIVVNNRLRGQIRKIIARITLTSKERVVRELAVDNMLNDLNKENLALLRAVRQSEKDGDILSKLNMAIALDDLKHNDSRQIRLDAVDIIDGRLQPIVLNTLNSLLDTDAEGTPVEKDEEVRKKVLAAKESIELKISFYEVLQRIFYGLSLGSILLLIATGLAITFGVMGVINMAHGELIMLGAYTAYVVQLLLPSSIEYSILVAIPLAFAVSGLCGILIERYVIRYLRGRPLETLLATFGISLILQQTVRSIFSPLNRQVISPSWLSGSLEINPVFSLTYNRLYILAFAILVLLCLQLVLKKTKLGLQVRAVSQNRAMARSMGVRTERVDALTFGLGAGVAGVAGVALSQLTNVGPNLGQAYIVDSFMVVVFGGVGNLWGTMVGGFTLGIANKFLEPMTGPVLANIFVLIFIILFIQKRPSGLFPQRGRAAE